MFRPPPRPATLLIAFAIVLPLTAASCDDDPKDVSLGTATRTTVAENVEVPGSVTAKAAATLTAPADGTLEALRVEAGSQVTKGQVVAIIDSPSAQRRLADAQEAMDASSRGGAARLDTTEFTMVRHRTDANADASFMQARTAADTLADPMLKAAMLTQIDAAEKQYTAASEAVNAAVRSVQRGVAGLGQAMEALTLAQRVQARQAYLLASAAVDALTLRAPVSGVVQLGGTATGGGASLSDLLAGGSAAAASAGGGARAAALPGVDVAIPRGAAVSAGTPIVTIVDTSQLGLVAEVDETDVLLVTPDTKATVELDAATGASYPATVRAVDELPTTSARGGVSYRVRLALAAGTYPDGSRAPVPRPGMSAIVRLRVRQAEDAVTVPASAVVNADGHDTVWTVRRGRAERVTVTLGVQGDDAVQIVDGVTDGEQVVVGGADRVRPGQQVR